MRTKGNAFSHSDFHLNSGNDLRVTQDSNVSGQLIVSLGLTELLRPSPEDYHGVIGAVSCSELKQRSLTQLSEKQ